MSAPPSLSFRALFVFTQSGEVAFSQRFSSVEARLGQKNQVMPSDIELSHFFQKNVAPNLAGCHLQPEFYIDSATPLVILTTKTYILGVIPLLLSKSEPHVELAASYVFLTFFESASRQILKALQPTNPPTFFAPLRQLILHTMPYGTLIVHDAMFAARLCTPGDSQLYNVGYQLVNPVPSWKTSLRFPLQMLDLKLRETVMGSIDGDKTFYSAFGELRCVAQINYLPDIKVKLEKLEDLECISGHHTIKQFSGGEFVFAPPTGIYQLLHWRVKQMAEPPVTGHYSTTQNEEETSFSLTVSVRPPVKRVIVSLPFPGRGSIVKHQFQNPAGGLLKAKKKEGIIMWNMKVTEGSSTLSGTLTFDQKPVKVERDRVFVSFKSKKKSFSGVSIDPASVASNFANSNVNTTVSSSFSSEANKYVIWATDDN